MRKSDQKLIILYGFHNSGKTLFYNLFQNEENFICLDIYKHHYHIYEKEIIDQIGEQNNNRLKKIILSKGIFNSENFLIEIGHLMNEFPEHNFIIKTGNRKWIEKYHKLFDSWFYHVKIATPLKIENIKHFIVVRHPKICLATIYHDDFDMGFFLYNWKIDYKFMQIHSGTIFNVLKIEDIKNNVFIKSVLKNKNLDEIMPYTDFDINEYRTNIFENFDNFQRDLKIIDIELKDLCEYLNYDLEDKIVEKYIKELKLIYEN